MRLPLILLVPVVACAQSQGADGAVAMFRGDASHSGRYATRGAQHFGGLVWRFTTNGPVRSSPTVAGNAVYIGSSDGRFHALDRTTGTQRWSFDAGAGIASAAAVTSDAVLFTTEGRELIALDRTTGRVRWRKQFGADAPLAWGRESGDIYTSSPAVVGSTVIVGGGDGTLGAFDVASGSRRWSVQTGGRVRSSPAVADGVAYVGSFDGNVYAVDAVTGALKWKFATEGASLDSRRFGYDRRSIQSSPAIANGVVYVGARDGAFYAIDAARGTLRWRFAHDNTSWSINSAAIGDADAYEGSSDAQFFHAVSLADGKERWRIKTTGVVWSSPALAGTTVYVGDGSGLLHALDAATGAERWSYQTGAVIHSSPVVADDIVYVGSGDGSVYAIRAADRELVRAVFWDSTLLRRSSINGSSRIRLALARRGYTVLDSAALGAWLRARVADKAPSVIVFAIDYATHDVAAVPSDSVLLRRYLNAGGKVVWLGVPPLLWPTDSTGERDYSRIQTDAPTAILGVDHSASQFDRLGATVTADGARWGLSGWWLGQWGVKPSRDLDVLARDEHGDATAWVKRYGGAPGTGFVQIGRSEWPDDAIRALVTAAEFRPELKP